MQSIALNEVKANCQLHVCFDVNSVQDILIVTNGKERHR